MKVWICYHCHSDGLDVWETVEKVFDDEVKAICWAEDPAFEATAYDWRRYEAKEVE